MANNTLDDSQLAARPDSVSSLPPPYYERVERVQLPNRSSLNSLNTSQLEEATGTHNNSPITPSLQLRMIASCTDNWQSTPYECCCVLEDRFLLLGYHDGIQLLDLANPESKPQTIIWIRARSMVVIESCRVVLILAGRYKQVRCYSYDALLRLVYAVLSLDWDQRRDKQFDIPSRQAWEHVASQSGKAPESSSSETPPETLLPALNNIGLTSTKPHSKQISLVDQLTLSGLTKAYCIGNEVILQNIYYKLPESKDALDIQTYQTSSFVFAAVKHRDKIVLWQRKRDHPLRPFYRLKVLWIPTEAKSVSFADDRVTLRHILAVFSSEATAIELRDSKVQTVAIDPTLERLYQTTWVREQYEHQLVSPRSPNSPIPTSLFQSNPSSASSSNSATVYPSLPVSLSVPPIQWTSLLQLPFYPDTLPATSLTTEFSIPPSYATVVTSLSSAPPPDPVALPFAAAPQLFFATLMRQSYIIDLSGTLFSTQVYRWSETPLHIEFIELDDWYAVGFGPTTVEMIHFKTAQVQRIMHGVPVKFLGRWDQTMDKKSVFKSLFWSWASNGTHVYMINK